MLEFAFHVEAEEELEEAYRWYLGRSPQAAYRFLELAEVAMFDSREFPDRWPSYLHGTQYIRMIGYPYALVYLREPTRVYGVAVAHLHRRPGYWKERLN